MMVDSTKRTDAAAQGAAAQGEAAQGEATRKAAGHTVHYVCKYTPVELLEAMGAECVIANEMLPGFDTAEQVSGANICGFGKTILELAMSGKIRELVLVDCCDVIRSVYDILEDWGGLDFLYLTGMLHCDGECARELMVQECKDLIAAYSEFSGATFDVQRFLSLFPSNRPNGRAPRGHSGESAGEPFVSVLGARLGDELEELVRQAMPLAVRNDTCVNNRDLRDCEVPAELAAGFSNAGGDADGWSDGNARSDQDIDELLLWYSGRLFEQIPCMRMADTTGRRQLLEDPDLVGVIYHTVKFCDFYSFEYAEVSRRSDLPLVKIESDYSTQSVGQLTTRLEAFAESLLMQPGIREASERWRQRVPAEQGASDDGGEVAAAVASASQSASTGTEAATAGSQAPSVPLSESGTVYYAGIDSGSTSTDVVVMDGNLGIVASSIIPTGGGASISAEKALAIALEQAGIGRDEVVATVATGYGRSAIQIGDKSVTEISCHARGARYLDPNVRSIVDIGGQDSKVIVLDDAGNVANFAMNDKCAAGTGRFLEMMARTLQLELDEMSRRGLSYKEDITISSTCSVFAESEVVSLVAQNKDIDSIVHGLCKSISVRVHSLARRVKAEPPYMMTGGVSKNAGVVKALEEKLGATLEVSDKAQLCGAIGAALYASDLKQSR